MEQTTPSSPLSQPNPPICMQQPKTVILSFFLECGNKPFACDTNRHFRLYLHDICYCSSVGFINADTVRNPLRKHVPFGKLWRMHVSQRANNHANVPGRAESRYHIRPTNGHRSIRPWPSSPRHGVEKVQGWYPYKFNFQTAERQQTQNRIRDLDLGPARVTARRSAAACCLLSARAT